MGLGCRFQFSVTFLKNTARWNDKSHALRCQQKCLTSPTKQKNVNKLEVERKGDQVCSLTHTQLPWVACVVHVLTVTKLLDMLNCALKSRIVVAKERLRRRKEK